MVIAFHTPVHAFHVSCHTPLFWWFITFCHFSAGLSIFEQVSSTFEQNWATLSQNLKLLLIVFLHSWAICFFLKQKHWSRPNYEVWNFQLVKKKMLHFNHNSQLHLNFISTISNIHPEIFVAPTLPKTNIAMENSPFWWYLQGNMGIFMGFYC